MCVCALCTYIGVGSRSAEGGVDPVPRQAAQEGGGEAGERERFVYKQNWSSELSVTVIYITRWALSHYT